LLILFDDVINTIILIKHRPSIIAYNINVATGSNVFISLIELSDFELFFLLLFFIFLIFFVLLFLLL